MTDIQFNTFLINNRSHLYRSALLLTKSHEDSNDLVQETYLKALRYRERLTDHSNLKGWVMTILRHAFISRYRMDRIRHEIVDVTPDLHYINLAVDKDFFAPESNYAEKEITKAIDDLNYNIQVPFKLHINGYKYNEIADQLNIDMSAVKSRIFRARKKLMSELKDYKLN